MRQVFRIHRGVSVFLSGWCRRGCGMAHHHQFAFHRSSRPGHPPRYRSRSRFGQGGFPRGGGQQVRGPRIPPQGEVVVPGLGRKVRIQGGGCIPYPRRGVRGGRVDHKGGALMHPSEEVYCEKGDDLVGKTIVMGITGSIAATTSLAPSS